MTFDDLGDFRDGKRASEGGLQPGEHQVRAYRDPKMDLDRVLRVAPERLYGQVPLDPFVQVSMAQRLR